MLVLPQAPTPTLNELEIWLKGWGTRRKNWRTVKIRSWAIGWIRSIRNDYWGVCWLWWLWRRRGRGGCCWLLLWRRRRRTSVGSMGRTVDSAVCRISAIGCCWWLLLWRKRRSNCGGSIWRILVSAICSISARGRWWWLWKRRMSKCGGSIGRILVNAICRISGRGCRRGFIAIRIRIVLSFNSNVRGIRRSWSYPSSKSTTVKSMMMRRMWSCEGRDSTKRDSEEDDLWKEHGRIDKVKKVKTRRSYRKKGERRRLRGKREQLLGETRTWGKRGQRVVR